MVSQNIGDIWVLTGGGCQIQAFFGNSKGYIAILYLGMDNEVPKKKEKPELIVQGKYLDKYFDGQVSKFEIKDIELMTYKSTYGKNEENDDDYDLIYGN